MVRNLVILLAAAALSAAENPWDKVKDLKSGAEVRILKIGAAQPIEAKFAEADDERVVVVIKNEQRAIAKDEIARLDARQGGGKRMTTETKTTINRPDVKPQASPQSSAPVPGQTYSSGVNFGGKPGYETIYRRVAHDPLNSPPAKK